MQRRKKESLQQKVLGQLVAKCERINLDPFPCHIQKLKEIKDLKVKAKALPLLEDGLDINVHNLWIW